MKGFWYVLLIAFVVALIAFPLAALSVWLISLLLEHVGFWYTVSIFTTMCCLRVILDDKIWKEFS